LSLLRDGEGLTVKDLVLENDDRVRVSDGSLSNDSGERQCSEEGEMVSLPSRDHGSPQRSKGR